MGRLLRTGCISAQYFLSQRSQLVPRALEIAASEDVLFRQGLPVNFMSFMGATNSEDVGFSLLDFVTLQVQDPRRAKFEKHAKKLFAKLVCWWVATLSLIVQIDYAPIDAAADRMAVKFIHDSLPPSLLERELKNTLAPL